MAYAARQHSWQISVTPVFSWLSKVTAVIAAWHRRARDRQALRHLSDHYLQDIGLTRHQVMRECGKPFWRR